mgnify:CR=1 FL=1
MQSATEQLEAFQSNLSGEKEERDALMAEITQKKIDLSSAGQNVYSMEENMLRLKEEAKIRKAQQG